MKRKRSFERVLDRRVQGRKSVQVYEKALRGGYFMRVRPTDSRRSSPIDQDKTLFTFPLHFVKKENKQKQNAWPKVIYYP